nr:nucleotidyl transferase domain-containing protein [Tanacetum cinerariifolium]
AYMLKFTEASMTHNVEPKTKIPKAESEELDMIRVLLLIREQHKKENNSGIVCKGTSCCKEIFNGILTAIPLGELQSKVERGSLQTKNIKHQTCQVWILKTDEAYPKLMLTDMVDIVDQIFEQKVQDFLELIKKREHLDVLQESEEARISNEVEANQKRIKKDLEKQHVLRQKVDNMINQNHLFKRHIILIKAWCYYERRILGAHHGLISTYALETLVLYNFHVFNNSFARPPEQRSPVRCGGRVTAPNTMMAENPISMRAKHVQPTNRETQSKELPRMTLLNHLTRTTEYLIQGKAKYLFHNDTKKIPLPGFTSTIYRLSMDNSDLIDGDGWTSSLAEVPIIMGAWNWICYNENNINEAGHENAGITSYGQEKIIFTLSFSLYIL